MVSKDNIHDMTENTLVDIDNDASIKNNPKNVEKQSKGDNNNLLDDLGN